jgi:hypothetical protein
MEYQVPQFIEVEDKIIGPLTLRQFIYLAGSAGFCIIFFVYLPFFVALLFAIPVAVLGITLSFYKINGKPFVEILEAGFNYYTGGKLFLWKHEPKKDQGAPTQSAAAAAKTLEESRAAARLTQGKLSELAWSLDVRNHLQK